MKELFLLRHAKSSWDDPTLADFDRPLAPRGESAAPRVGRVMAARGWLPDHALVSPARRTRRTWEVVAAELPEAPGPVFAETLYESAPAAILAAIRAAPAEAGSVIVVGHNPGLENLADALCGERSDTTAREAMTSKYPTAALARFVVDGAWADCAFGAARLTHFIRPKDLKQVRRG